jgi:hypothetical protein
MLRTKMVVRASTVCEARHVRLDRIDVGLYGTDLVVKREKVNDGGHIN